MSLDRLHSKQGLICLGAAPTVSGYVGGVEVSGHAGFVAGTAAEGGGAYYCSPMPRDSAAQTIASGGTITHNNSGVVFIDISGGANATGVILQAGEFDGQLVTIGNTNASFTAQFAAAGTSRVANGTSCVISTNKAQNLSWSVVAQRWFSIL